MNQAIIKRINLLRTILETQDIAAFIIPSTDPHLSEYVASHWKCREWISEFNGSAGTIVITRKDAGLWTDSRYFLQAAHQLGGTTIQLFKENLPQTLDIPHYLIENLQPHETVGIDGNVFSVNEERSLQQQLKEKNISLKSMNDPFTLIWNDRPKLPENQIYIYDTKYAGESIYQKIASIRRELTKIGTEAVLISALDEIAWSLNLRGNDIHCNSVFISYLLIDQSNTHLFIQSSKINEEVYHYLTTSGVHLYEYDQFKDYLHTLTYKNILLDPAKTNYAVYSSISNKCQIIENSSPVSLLKAVRNTQEIKGLHTAMLRDGIALVRFLIWLEKNISTGKESEISISKKLQEFRSVHPLYRGESFDTIAGYKAHGAIVHYEATPETDILLKPEGFLLLDSGAQYLDGTTDITRTIALGPLTEEEKTDYTLVLKGHIALATAVFPEGTRGAQLDVLARMPLWKSQMNYLHGTGHGVGHFLNVHEGPQSIRMNENPVPLRAGMLTSNEPGIYKSGSHGVRIENLVLTVDAGEGMYGNYLKFETVTLCPIDKKGILPELMTEGEIGWLDNYHQKVYELLSPFLEEEEQEWLKKACSKL